MRVVLKMKALEPISVGYESIGIETLLYSLPIVKEDGTALEVPVIPGNSLRGVLRDQMALQFLEDVKSALTESKKETGAPEKQESLNAHIGTLMSLFSGGILSGEEKSQGMPNIKEIMENYIYPLLPLSIMGVALKKIIIPGRIKVGIGYPVTKETKSLLTDLGVSLNESTPALSEITSSVLITRKDDTNKVMQLKELLNVQGKIEEAKAGDSAVQQRLYRQVVVPGTVFYSYVEDIIPMTDAEWGLVLKTLERLDKIGGRVAGGLGKVKIELSGIDDKKREDFIKAYTNNIQDNLNTILNALETNPNSFFKSSSNSSGTAGTDGKGSGA
ncbi:RAMP superfamily CRISPR-associated protein [Thermococcus sp.]|uniref:RAMP superfamily CRISPR-associated protein n=1 Tax=Thermococcus sp. TaxID=35749 RepID=UPI00261A3252|nr:RAMP superfamily CRISPR-associated protein [Thermococcus sp.]